LNVKHVRRGRRAHSNPVRRPLAQVLVITDVYVTGDNDSMM